MFVRIFALDYRNKNLQLFVKFVIFVFDKNNLIMKHLIIFLTLLTVYSCSTSRHVTQLVERTSVDTVYLSNVQYDSIYVYQDRLRQSLRPHPQVSRERPRHHADDTVDECFIQI